MKKFSKIISSMFLVLVIATVGAIFAACGEGQIVKAEVKPGSIATEYQQGSAPNFGGIKVIVTYENDSTKEVGFDDLEIGTVDYLTLGTKTVNASYDSFAFTFDIEIVEQVLTDVTITAYMMPRSMTLFSSNIQTKVNKEEEFKNRTDPYYVGTDNAFKFFPTVVATDLDTYEDVVALNYESEVKVEENISGGYVAITGASLENIVEVNAFNGTFQFKPAAVGRTFKITQKPIDARYPMHASIPTQSLSFEVCVMEGLNVYTIMELQFIDSGYVGWHGYRQDNGISANIYNKFILHNDIILNDENLPANFFNGQYLQHDTLAGGAGSGMFRRDNLPGDEFEFVGNYFTLDCSQLPLTDVKGDPSYGSADKNKLDIRNVHLFTFQSKFSELSKATEYGAAVDIEQASSLVKNLNVIGNSGRDNQDEKFGGLDLFRNETVGSDLIIENVIASQFGTFGKIRKYNEVEIKDSRFYDAYSYAFKFTNVGENNVMISNTEMKNSGGPMFYITASGVNSVERYTGAGVDEFDAASYENFTPVSYIYATPDCTFENYITGTEAWFVSLGSGASDLVTGITGSDMLNKPTSGNTVTILKSGKVNMIAAILSEGNPIGFEFQPLGGMIFLDEHDAVLHALDSNDSTFESFKNSFGAATGLPIISTKTAIALLVPGAGFGVSPGIYGSAAFSPGSAPAGLFVGNKVNMFFNKSSPPNTKYIGVVIDLYAVA